MQIKRKRATKKEFLERFILLAALLVIGLAVAVLHFKGVQLCLLRKHTGYPCLFCGSTRAALLLLQGRLVAAFLIQPLASLAMILSTFGGGVLCIFLFFKREVLIISFSSLEKRLLPPLALLLAIINWLYLLLY